MATTKQTIVNLVNTYVYTNYPTFAQGQVPLSDYFDVDTLTISPPSVADDLLVAILKAFVLVRSPELYNFQTTLSASELKNLVTDIDNSLARMKTDIDTIKTPLAAYLAGLP
jgi:hypothetical protein